MGFGCGTRDVLRKERDTDHVCQHRGLRFKRFRNKDCRKNILQYHAQRPYGRTGGCIGGFVESYKHIQSKDKPGKQYYAAQRGARQYAKARTSDKAGMRFDKETAAWPEL